MADAELKVASGKGDEQSAESSHGIHRLLCMIECPRKFGYRYVLGLRLPFDSTAIALGTVIHSCLENHYLGKDWRLAIAKAHKDPSSAFVAQRAANITTNYFNHYKNEKLHVIAVEREYAITVEGCLFTRRVDLTYEATGRLYFVDHKTAADPKRRTSQSEMDATLLSQELIGRIVCQQVHGYPYGGALLNLIPTGGGGTFNRYPLRFPAKMLEDMPRSLARWLKAEKSLLASGMSPWEYTQTYNCYSRYGVCDYWRLCAHGSEALNDYTVK